MKKRLSINLNQKMFDQITNIKTDSLILGVYEDSNISGHIKQLDVATGKALTKLKSLGELQGKLSQSSYLPTLSGIKAKRVYLVGCGKKGLKLSREEATKVLSEMTKCAISSKAENASILIPLLKVQDEEDGWLIQQVAFLCENNAYTYDAKLNKKNKTVNKLKKISISIGSKLSASKINKRLKIGQSIGRGSNTAKDLANLQF